MDAFLGTVSFIAVVYIACISFFVGLLTCLIIKIDLSWYKKIALGFGGMLLGSLLFQTILKLPEWGIVGDIIRGIIGGYLIMILIGHSMRNGDR